MQYILKRSITCSSVRFFRLFYNTFYRNTIAYPVCTPAHIYYFTIILCVNQPLYTAQRLTRLRRFVLLLGAVFYFYFIFIYTLLHLYIYLHLYIKHTLF